MDSFESVDNQLTQAACKTDNRRTKNWGDFVSGCQEGHQFSVLRFSVFWRRGLKPPSVSSLTIFVLFFQVGKKIEFVLSKKKKEKK